MKRNHECGRSGYGGTSWKSSARLVAVVGVLAALLLGGCEEEGVQTYAVPNSPPSSGGAMAAELPSTVAEDQAVDLGWTLPAGWHEAENAVAMRLVTLHAGQAGSGGEPVEVAISSLPGQGGGPLANINRWRGQIGLEPLGPQQLSQHAQMFEAPGGRYLIVVDMTGAGEASGDESERTEPQRIIAAIFHDGTQTWFAKMRDAPDRLEPHREAFGRFARSLHHRETEAAASSPSTTMLVDHRAPLAYEVPEGWIQDPTPSPMVAVAFNSGGVTDDQGSTRVTVARLAGDAGGELANLNRWRDQLGLAPVQAMSEQPTVQVTLGDGTGATLVDLTGPGQGEQHPAMLIAWAERAGAMWFFKMTGPRGLLQQQRPAFRSFLQSVRFGGER